jgi:transposase
LIFFSSEKRRSSCRRWSPTCTEWPARTSWLLIAGERDPKVLAQLARARARRKIAELEEALEGAEFFTAEHVALLGAMLGRIDRVNAEIARLTEVIEALLAPYEEQMAQAESMPGWGRRAAQTTLPRPGWT